MQKDTNRLERGGEAVPNGVEGAYTRLSESQSGAMHSDQGGLAVDRGNDYQPDTPPEFGERLVRLMLEGIRAFQPYDMDIWKRAVVFCHNRASQQVDNTRLVGVTLGPRYRIFVATALEQVRCPPQYWDWKNFPGVGPKFLAQLNALFAKFTGSQAVTTATRPPASSRRGVHLETVKNA